MSDALIQSQNTRIQQLEAQKRNLQRALKAEREGESGTKALKLRVAKLEADLGTANKARQDLEAAAKAAPDVKDARIKELEMQVSSHNHFEAFRSAAEKVGVKPAKVSDLYTLLKLKPGDQPASAEEFAETLTSAKEAHDWAFGEPSPDSGQKPGAAAKGGSQGIQLGAARPAAEGAGRGAPVTTASVVKYHREDLRKPDWQQTKPDLVKALADGTALCVDA
jgi:hypothetical protein